MAEELEQFVLGKSNLPEVEKRFVDLGEGGYDEYFVKGTDIRVEPTFYEDWDSLIQSGQMTESSAPEVKQGNYVIYDADKEGEYVFDPAGKYLGFRDAPRSSGLGGFLKESVEGLGPILSMIPVTAPYMAVYNAAKAAESGDWGKAILYALPAAGSIAGQMGNAAAASTLAEANKYAKILKTIDDKDLLSAAFQGADLAGISDVAGYDLNDVKKAVNLGMAIKNEDPMALVRAGMAYVPKAGSGKLGFDVGDLSSDVEHFGVQPGDTFSGGYVDMSAPDQGEIDLSEFLVRPTPIEIPEIVSGEPEYPEMVVTAPRDELPGFVYDMPEAEIRPTPIEIPEIVSEPEMPEMVITAPRLPEERPKFPEFPQIELTPEDLAPPEIVPTPIDIPPIVGPAPAPTPKPPAAPAPKPPAAPAPAPFDLAGLLLLLGGQQQGPIPLTVPENAADIKLMEEIFGTSLSAPSTGNETDKATALARLLRS